MSGGWDHCSNPPTQEELEVRIAWANDFVPVQRKVIERHKRRIARLAQANESLRRSVETLRRENAIMRDASAAATAGIATRRLLMPMETDHGAQG